MAVVVTMAVIAATNGCVQCIVAIVRVTFVVVCAIRRIALSLMQGDKHND